MSQLTSSASKAAASSTNRCVDMCGHIGLLRVLEFLARVEVPCPAFGPCRILDIGSTIGCSQEGGRVNVVMIDRHAHTCTKMPIASVRCTGRRCSDCMSARHRTTYFNALCDCCFGAFFRSAFNVQFRRDKTLSRVCAYATTWFTTAMLCKTTNGVASSLRFSMTTYRVRETPSTCIA